MMINRPKCGKKAVRFEMLYCGICHSDCHFGLNHLTGAMYPMVPGHELIGKVTEIGTDVTKVKVGDYVGVGCTIDSCQNCENCDAGDEQYCEKWTHTYNSKKVCGHQDGNQDV